MRPNWLFIGAVLGALAVGCGAFGAHGLKARFLADGALSESDLQQLANWETAARYQMYHALVLLVIGWLGDTPSAFCRWLSGAAMTLGTVIFSGCLYLLVFTGQRWLGAVVPIGGALLIVGWVSLAISAWPARTVARP